MFFMRVGGVGRFWVIFRPRLVSFTSLQLSCLLLVTRLLTMKGPEQSDRLIKNGGNLRFGDCCSTTANDTARCFFLMIRVMIIATRLQKAILNCSDVSYCFELSIDGSSTTEMPELTDVQVRVCSFRFVRSLLLISTQISYYHFRSYSSHRFLSLNFRYPQIIHRHCIDSLLYCFDTFY